MVRLVAILSESISSSTLVSQKNTPLVALVVSGSTHILNPLIALLSHSLPLPWLGLVRRRHNFLDMVVI